MTAMRLNWYQISACFLLWLILSIPVNAGEPKVQSTPDNVALLSVVSDCKDCPPMVRIPALPQSTGSLFAARHELTWKEYLAAVREAKCPLPTLSKDVEYDTELDDLADNYPVDRVSVDDFECYLNWINKKSGHRYRLPTSEEWEHLASAGTGTLYPWGNEIGFNKAAIDGQFDSKLLPSRTLFDPRFQRLASTIIPVESFEPNAWGIYDVVGNVGEYIEQRKRGSANCIARNGAEKCQLIAVRGGDTTGINLYRVGVGWIENNVNRTSHISWTFVSTPNLNRGFRLVRE